MSDLEWPWKLAWMLCDKAKTVKLNDYNVIDNKQTQT